MMFVTLPIASLKSTCCSQDHPVMSRRIPGGVMPDCQKCGECFDNWDRILAGELTLPPPLFTPLSIREPVLQDFNVCYLNA